MLSSKQALGLLKLQSGSEKDVRSILKTINESIAKLTEDSDNVGKLAETLTEYLYVRSHFETLLKSEVDGNFL